jgi:hypothetical protein
VLKLGSFSQLIFTLLLPEFFVPILMLFRSNFSISGSGIEAGVAKVLLKHPHTFTGVIDLHRVDGKGIPKTMRTHPTRPPGLWVNKRW